MCDSELEARLERLERQNRRLKRLGLLLLLIAGSGFLLAQASCNPPSSTVPIPAVTDSKGRPVPPGVTNDAELLIARCGRPSRDVSTAYEDPRPPIPVRVVEYRKHGLRFMFFPGGNAHVGDPPPYRWKLLGVTDMAAADPSRARVVDVSEAVRRMPCWAGK